MRWKTPEASSYKEKFKSRSAGFDLENYLQLEKQLEVWKNKEAGFEPEKKPAPQFLIILV